MEQLLIILNSLDIEPARSAAARLSHYRTLTFDPALHDELLESGLANVEFVDFEDCPTFAELHNGSRERALAAERELHAAIAGYLPGVDNFSWLHLNWYYLFIASHWYDALGADFCDRYAARFGDATPIVFINDNPALFFWPSYVPAIALLQAFTTAGIEFKAYTYGERADETDAIPMLLDLPHDAPGERWDLLVHLPTCMHDSRMLEAEIVASGKSVIAVAAKYWDLPLPAARSIGLARGPNLAPHLSPALQDQLANVGARLEQRIDAILAPVLRSESYRHRQCVQLASLYKSQLLAYWLAQQFFAGRPPRKMLLSDHDSGFHGPLLAYAEVNRIPVLFVPHSKTTADIQFSRDTVRCLTHPIQGDSIDDALGRRVSTITLAYPEHFSGSSATPEPLRKVGLLLNSMSLNGVFVSSYEVYMAGIARIVGWCRARGVELVVRGRPGHTMHALLEPVTGIDAATLKAGMEQPLAAFAAGCDLCLMYDAPTTAEIEFLKNGVPIMNPVPEGLAKYEAVIADTTVVPRGTIEEVLFKLDSFVADQANFHSFRTSQFARYVGGFADAQTLRSLL